jgi:hypothetical protein
MAHHDRDNLAKLIYSMPYGELMAVAGELASTCVVKEARPQMTTAQDFASLLYAWAEAIASDLEE